MTDHITPAPSTGILTAAPALTPPAGPPVESCPRCACARTVSYGARVGCCACGATWQATR